MRWQKNSIDEENTNASKESINQFAVATKEILSELDNGDTQNLVETDGLSDLFDFWRDIGVIAIEKEMKSVANYWTTSYSKVVDYSLRYAPVEVVNQSLSTHKEVTTRKQSKMGIHEDPTSNLEYLQNSMEYGRWDVQETILSTTSTIIHSAISVQQGRYSEDIGSMLDEYFKAWSKIISSDEIEIDREELSERYGDELSGFIESFSNPLERHNIELMASHPYLVDSLEDIGKTAANKGSKPSVKIIVSILIDLYLSTRNPKRTGAITNKVGKDRYVKAISCIAESGGEDGVEEVFKEFTGLPKINMGEYDSNLKAYDDLNSKLKEMKDWHFIEFIDFYRGREVIQELIEELAEDTGIETNSSI